MPNGQWKALEPKILNITTGEDGLLKDVQEEEKKGIIRQWEDKCISAIGYKRVKG